MKRIILIGLTVIGIAVITVVNINLNTKVTLSELALKNVEALTAEADKVPTKTCYTDNTQSSEAAQYKLKCPTDNDQTGIGDCPSMESWFRVGSSDRCHANSN
ncbi:MAG: NVEALA domain-containing protein [Prevotella sp.]|jgi:hypothetical protein|nr:NVEALA domain-containing protein [Prevotella sp.]